MTWLDSFGLKLYHLISQRLDNETAVTSGERFSMNVILLIALSVLAFAGNSVLTRLALAQSQISPGDFTAIRLVSGAVLLVLLCWRDMAKSLPTFKDATGILALFIYAITFTVAYVGMNAATGALVLFASVQVTLIIVARLKGTQLSLAEYTGVGLALAGLVWLLAPSATAPPLMSGLLMVTAGISWGFYTLDGRSAVSPLQKTARNFVGAAILGFIPLLFLDHGARSPEGIALAIASGAITSGLGYAIWYRVLPKISVAMAGASQLAVPIVAAAGGAALIGETISIRLVAASALVLLGIGITILAKNHLPKPGSNS
jgi:drug/metabolite transporter (DMT)-like permease